MNNLLIDSVRDLIVRDLKKLREEIDAYATDQALWVTGGHTKNSAGNLCLHLCGNLQHYIGTRLGNTGYIRHRDAEFSTKDLPRHDLLNLLDDTIRVVEKTLSSLDSSLLEKNYPEEVFQKPMRTGWFLIHLAGHLNYHLGQVNYHRRFTTA